jgi:hypothetical protein
MINNLFIYVGILIYLIKLNKNFNLHIKKSLVVHFLFLEEKNTWPAAECGSKWLMKFRGVLSPFLIPQISPSLSLDKWISKYAAFCICSSSSLFSSH